MTEHLPTPPDRGIGATPILLAAAGAFVVANLATWLWFRARQDGTDAQARERLRART